MKPVSEEKDRLLDRIWGFRTLGMYKDAIRECEKLIKIDPSDPSSYIELGFHYEKNGEIEEAIKCYKYMMERFPKCSYPYVNLGYIFEKFKKRNDLAMVCYEKASELNPDDEWALNNIGVILQAEGRWKDAVSYYERACEVSKQNDGITDYKILHNLAWACYRCKNYKKAWLIYDYLAKEYPDNASIYADFGHVNFKLGVYDRALKSFDKALSLCQDSRYYRRLYQVAARK